MSILNKILCEKRRHLADRQAQLPIAELRRMVQVAPPVRSLRDALTSHRFSIIGEIKKHSPSGSGMDSRNIDAALRVYGDSSVISAVSVLTDEPFFGGSIDSLQHARQVKKPILRKDFILDEYQVWEARAFGADAILLMVTIHSDPEKFRSLFDLARSIGLDVLVELGMDRVLPDQQAMVPQEAGIWGINSRKFHSSQLALRANVSKVLGHKLGRDFTTAKKRHQELRQFIPAGKIAVAESGIRKPSDIDELMRLNYNAALIGTAFLKGPKDIEDVVESFSERINWLLSCDSSGKNNYSRLHNYPT